MHSVVHVGEQVAPEVPLPLAAVRAVRAGELRLLAALEARVVRQRGPVQVHLAARRARELAGTPGMPTTPRSCAKAGASE